MRALLFLVHQAEEGHPLVRVLVWLFLWPLLVALAVQLPRVPGTLAARLKFHLGQLQIEGGAAVARTRLLSRSQPSALAPP